MAPARLFTDTKCDNFIQRLAPPLGRPAAKSIMNNDEIRVTIRFHGRRLGYALTAGSMASDLGRWWHDCQAVVSLLWVMTTDPPKGHLWRYWLGWRRSSTFLVFAFTDVPLRPPPVVIQKFGNESFLLLVFTKILVFRATHSCPLSV